MDTIAHQLRDIRDIVTIPRSVPGLVTRRVLVMGFIPGVPLLEAGKKMQNLTAFQRRAGSRRILSR